MGHAALADFSRFGKSFQEGLTQLILQDRPFADQICEVLDINYFELKYLQVFVEKIIKYKDKYNVHPSLKTMTTILRTELEGYNEATQKQVRDYFARIYTEEETDGAEYIKSTALDFCRKQNLKEAMIKCVPLLEEASFDEIATIINDSLNLGLDNDFGHDYLADFEVRFQIKTRNPVSTGWDEIDDICKGGLGRGELGVVIAPTGAGKSMALTHLGAHAVHMGKTVVHYTLELAEESIGNRYDSCLTGTPLGNLFSFKEMIYEKVQDVKGKLIIKEYATKSASVKTLQNHLQKLSQRDIKADMIIVDYGDLLRPALSHKERRHDLQSIYEDLRCMAQENKCPVWTASQTNRSGLNAEVITMEAISEAFSKCFVADFVFSLSRTIEDKNNNTGRVFVAKNRFGPDGIVYPIFMDPARVKIKVLPSTGETPAEIAANTAKEQAELLKEKYKQFRNEQKG